MSHPPRANGGSGGGRPAFTLVELLAVVLVILIITTFIIRAARVGSDKAKIARCKSELMEIQMALDSYRADWGDYPSTVRPGWSTGNPLPPVLGQALVAGASGTQGRKYLFWSAGKIGAAGRAEMPYQLLDPWGTPYQYKYKSGGNFEREFRTRQSGENADVYLLYSLGPDTVGSADDIGIFTSGRYNNPMVGQSSYTR
jgi:general secretion pathway protein G